MLQLFKKYQARNARHLMYIRYKRNISPINALKATPKGMSVLDKIAHGYTYCEIAMMLNVSKSCIEKHINKLLFDNKCDSVNDLIILYADWEHNNG